MDVGCRSILETGDWRLETVWPFSFDLACWSRTTGLGPMNHNILLIGTWRLLFIWIERDRQNIAIYNDAVIHYAATHESRRSEASAKGTNRIAMSISGVLWGCVWWGYCASIPFLASEILQKTTTSRRVESVRMSGKPTSGSMFAKSSLFGFVFEHSHSREQNQWFPFAVSGFLGIAVHKKDTLATLFDQASIQWLDDIQRGCWGTPNPFTKHYTLYQQQQ